MDIFQQAEYELMALTTVGPDELPVSEKEIVSRVPPPYHEELDEITTTTTPEPPRPPGDGTGTGSTTTVVTGETAMVSDWYTSNFYTTLIVSHYEWDSSLSTWVFTGYTTGDPVLTDQTSGTANGTQTEFFRWHWTGTDWQFESTYYETNWYTHEPGPNNNYREVYTPSYH